MVRVVSPNAPYPVPTLFHIFPNYFGHKRPFIPNTGPIDPFGPILGPLGSKFGYLCIGNEVTVVSPCIPYPVPTLFKLFWTIWASKRAPTLLTHFASKSVACGSLVQYIESDNHVSHCIYVMYFGYRGGKIMFLEHNSKKELA